MADLQTLLAAIAALDPAQAEQLTQAVAASATTEPQNLGLEAAFETRGEAWQWIKSHGKENPDADKYRPKDMGAPITDNQVRGILAVAKSHKLVCTVVLSPDGSIVVSTEKAKVAGGRSGKRSTK